MGGGERVGVGALGDAEVGGDDGVDVADGGSGGEGDVAAAEGSDALVEVVEVDPPAGGEDVVSDAAGGESAGGWVDGAAAVEPVGGELELGIGDELAGAVAGEPFDVASCGEGDIAAGHAVLCRVERGELCCAEAGGSGGGLAGSGDIEGAAEGGVGDGGAGGVDGGELVEEADVGGGGDGDVAAAGADDLPALGDDRAGEGVVAAADVVILFVGGGTGFTEDERAWGLGGGGGGCGGEVSASGEAIGP